MNIKIFDISKDNFLQEGICICLRKDFQENLLKFWKKT